MTTDVSPTDDLSFMWVILNEECYEACKSLLPFLITKKKKDIAKQIVEHYDKKSKN